MTKDEALEALRAQHENCRTCHHSYRTNGLCTLIGHPYRKPYAASPVCGNCGAYASCFRVSEAAQEAATLGLIQTCCRQCDSCNVFAEAALSPCHSYRRRHP